jgi:hypothetical protein
MPMDEKTLSDQISHLMNDTPEADPGPSEENTDEKKDILVESLKTAAGQTDGALDAALDEFMEGKGVLHETTRAAITRGSSGLSEVIKLLTSQFKLSPAVAKIIASLILKMQSSVSKETAKDSTTKKKPRRKAKPKAASSAKKKPSSSKKPKKKTAAKAQKTTSKKPAKKKTAAKTKPRSSKKTASTKAAKKKPAAKTSQKKTTTKAKPKMAKRSNSVEIP